MMSEAARRHRACRRGATNPAGGQLHTCHARRVPARPSGRRKHRPLGLDILYEDRDIIVVNKAAGLLTIGTGRDAGRTAHAALDNYVRKGNPKSRERIFIVHRLDRDTSGALVFARSEEAKRTLQDNWPSAEKVYLALVEGHPDPPEGMATAGEIVLDGEATGRGHASTHASPSGRKSARRSGAQPSGTSVTPP